MQPYRVSTLSVIILIELLQVHMHGHLLKTLLNSSCNNDHGVKNGSRYSSLKEKLSKLR